MLAVTGATPAEVEDRARRGRLRGRRRSPPSPSSTARAAPWSAAPPTPCAASGPPLEKRAAAEAAEIEAKTRGGRAFDPDRRAASRSPSASTTRPSPRPSTMVRDWAEACGLDAGLAEHLAHAICVETVDWPRELTDAVGAEHPLWSSTSARPTSPPT